MIPVVDEALKQLLTEQFPPVFGAVPDLMFAPPSDAAPESCASLHLFLHDVRENTALREEARLVERTPDGAAALVGRPPVYMDLRYVVSAQADSPGAEHALLAAALEILLRHRVLNVVKLLESHPQWGARVAALRYPQPFPMQIAQPEAQPDPGRFWQALGCRPRASFSLVITATVEAQRPVETPLVTQNVLGIPQDPLQSNPQRVLHRVCIAGTITTEATSPEEQAPAPIRGALVQLADLSQTATSDERGFYYFLNLPPGEYTVRVWADGHTSATQKVVVAGGGGQYSPADFTLEHAPLFGHVLRAPGQRPAADVEVLADEYRVRTDAQGYYAFPGLAPGKYRVRTAPLGFLPQEQEVAVQDRDGRPQRVDLLLQPAALSGRVQDRNSRSPLAGAQVSLPGQAVLETDPQGYFALPHLGPGRYWAGASAAGYREAEQSFEVRASRNGALAGAVLIFDLEPMVELPSATTTAPHPTRGKQVESAR